MPAKCQFRSQLRTEGLAKMRPVNPDRRCQDRVGNAVGVDLHALHAERQTSSASRKSGLVCLSTKPHLTFGLLPGRQLP